MDDGPLRDLRFSLVGPGRVGLSMASWLSAAGARLVSVAAIRPRRVPALGTSAVSLGELASGGQELLLLSVPAGALEAVAATLSPAAQAAVVLHTTGARGCEPIAALRLRGSAVGSMHPLRAFPRPVADPAVAAGTFFAIDGDPPAQALARRLAGTWKARCAEVPDELRPIYHLAASLAAGGVATMLAEATELGRRAGVADAAVAAYADLAHGALEAAGDDPASAITGPAARGDQGLLDQLDRLDALAPRLRVLAVVLALETLRLATAGAESSDEQRELRRALVGIASEAGFLEPLLVS